MKKLYSLIALIGLTFTINTYSMDPERHPMVNLIDTLVGNDARATPTNWDAIFALLNELIQKGNLFTVNEYFSIDGMSLLCKAAEDNNFLAVKRLLGLYKANPNRATITNGMTPLMIACFNGNTKIVEILIQYRANPYIKNTQGHDSFYFANQYYQLNPRVRNKAILNILKTYEQ